MYVEFKVRTLPPYQSYVVECNQFQELNDILQYSHLNYRNFQAANSCIHAPIHYLWTQ